ncbi:uncharacterized protein LOC141560526 isoform X1 [Sminthopsis crassicaudata]|uniref:uncharacterized protein LOC141560526 isoform X1 n=1 Tax=Sminthopsis crassicaudata TaxID=9301 RepID=UPI003D692CE6
MFKYRQGSAGREPASRAESGAKAGIRCESPGQPVEMSGKLASVSASRPRGMTWEDWKSCKKLPKDEHLRGVIIGLGGKRMLCDHNHPWGQATRRLLQNITLGTICAPKGYAFFCKTACEICFFYALSFKLSTVSSAWRLWDNWWGHTPFGRRCGCLQIPCFSSWHEPPNELGMSLRPLPAQRSYRRRDRCPFPPNAFGVIA